MTHSPTVDWIMDMENLSASSLRSLSHEHSDPRMHSLAERYLIRKRMHCADGFSMSVQYGPGMYCNGRTRFMGGDMDNEDDPLPFPTSVEIGFPTSPEPLLVPYAEEVDKPYWTEKHSLIYSFHSSLKYGRRRRDRLLRFLLAFWPTHCMLTQTVYGWVPVEVCDQVIRRHGGIVYAEEPLAGMSDADLWSKVRS